MRSLIRVFAFAVAAFLTSQSLLSAQIWGQPKPPVSGACFYEDVNFGGAYFCATTNTASTQVNYRMNNRISSIRLFGGAEVTVYQEYNFTGRSRTFGSDVDDLRRGGWNDRITSYRVRMSDRGPSGRYSGSSQGGYGGSNSLDMVIGRMEWRGRVDDKIHLAIKGRSVEQRTISGTTLAEGRATFTSGLPNEGVQVSVEKLAGRGTVRVVQQPSRLNAFTAIIEILDDSGGAQEYRIEVTWR